MVVATGLRSRLVDTAAGLRLRSVDPATVLGLGLVSLKPPDQKVPSRLRTRRDFRLFPAPSVQTADYIRRYAELKHSVLLQYVSPCVRVIVAHTFLPSSRSHVNTSRSHGVAGVPEELKSVRVQVLMTPSEVAELDDWAHDARASNRSEAIRHLVRQGIEGAERQDTAAAIDAIYRLLNKDQRTEVETSQLNSVVRMVLRHLERLFPHRPFT